MLEASLSKHNKNAWIVTFVEDMILYFKSIRSNSLRLHQSLVEI
jgi:hypothetical protein